MNRIISIVFLCVLLYFPLRGADDSAESTQIILLKEISNNRDNRPRTPSRQQITCIYDGECIYINFLIPEGQCSLLVTEQNLGISNCYSFDSEDETVVRLGIIKNAMLRIDTGFGKSYEGAIQ